MTKPLPTISALVNALRSIVMFGQSINAAGRQRVINVCGELCDELVRAMQLAESYLQGARYYKDDQALIQYLAKPDQKLMQTYLEHNLCAAIYSLSDRFRQVFDPTRYSMSIPKSQEISDLVNVLKNGERFIVDDMQDMVDSMSGLAHDLMNAATPDVSARIKDEIMKAIDFHLKNLKAYKQAIKRVNRRIADEL